MKKGAYDGAFLLAAHTENRTPFCHLKSGHPSQVDDVGSTKTVGRLELPMSVLQTGASSSLASPSSSIFPCPFGITCFAS